MLYFALRKGYSDYNVIDIKNTDYTELEFPPAKASVINKILKEAMIKNGIAPERVDTILAYVISRNIVVGFDADTADYLWNQTELLSAMISKELKPFAYWLNEYILIDNINTFINELTNFLIIRNRKDIVEFGDKSAIVLIEKLDIAL